MGSEFLVRGDLENMTLVFQDLVLFSIWHTTFPIVVGPYTKVLLEIVRFYWQPIMLQCWDFDIVCGEVLVSH